VEMNWSGKDREALSGKGGRPREKIAPGLPGKGGPSRRIAEDTLVIQGSDVQGMSIGQ